MAEKKSAGYGRSVVLILIIGMILIVPHVVPLFLFSDHY